MEIHAAVEHPPRWFLYHPAGRFTNLTGVLQFPFVDLRNAAHWLYVDGIEALHAGDLARAGQDHHALIQLAQFNREDPMLVAAMIRVAIAGLGLQFSWQALQHTNWTGADLLAMQRDWERVDLLAAVETGWTGERAATELVFATSRREGIGWITRAMTSRANVNPWERLRNQAVGLMWDAEEDELFALQHHQVTLEAIRRLRADRPWPAVQVLIQSAHDRVNRTIGSANGLNRYRYLLSAMVIPNLSKAVQTSVRHETQRRLTVTATALQRYHLRHLSWPETLKELVPEYLAAVPGDPMCAEPLRYRREANGGFVLYSVGEDGADNGGDPTPANNLSKADPWNGLDFVWPKPAN